MNDNHKFIGAYRGKILSNSDPDKLGRVKAEIYPMLIGVATAQDLDGVDGIETAQIPWAVPAMPLSSGAGAGIGSFAVPAVGSFIFVFFEEGDINQPVYFAEAQTKTYGLPLSRLTNYPDRKVIETSSGTKIIIDDSTGHVIITGAGDVVVQGTNVRLNPTSSWE